MRCAQRPAPLGVRLSSFPSSKVNFLKFLSAARCWHQQVLKERGPNPSSKSAPSASTRVSHLTELRAPAPEHCSTLLTHVKAQIFFPGRGRKVGWGEAKVNKAFYRHSRERKDSEPMFWFVHFKTLVLVFLTLHHTAELSAGMDSEQSLGHWHPCQPNGAKLRKPLAQSLQPPLCWPCPVLVLEWLICSRVPEMGNKVGNPKGELNFIHSGQPGAQAT